MFRNLPRYKAYATAGGWIAEVPTQWLWTPARTIFVERKATGFTEEPLLSVTIGRGVIPQADLIASTSKKDSSNTDKSKYKLVNPGDVVYNKMRAWQGASGSSRHRGIVSPAYVVMTPLTALPEYVHHLVRTPMFAKEAERWSYGITSDQWSLRPEHFKMIRFPLPPPEEQAAIVKYLAHANARIDKAIAAKRRLIALLAEQKLSGIEFYIHQVANDADEPLLGRALRRIEQGISPPAAEGAIEEGQWAVLSLSAVNRGVFSSAAVKPVPPGINVPDGLELSDGDLLMTRSNTRDRVGDVAVVVGVRARTFMSDLIYRLTPIDGLLDTEFASYLLRSRRVRDQIEANARGSSGTMPKLSQSHIKNLRIPLPALEIQRRTVEDITRLAAPLRKASERIHHEITLLREFRTRLVADVVTGQVDVRAIAATLPEASEDVAGSRCDGPEEEDAAAGEPGDE